MVFTSREGFSIIKVLQIALQCVLQGLICTLTNGDSAAIRSLLGFNVFLNDMLTFG